ncbi:hypothetical protein [Sinomonas humi]|nr:hypothetical protein [Sinomonas humi]
MANGEAPQAKDVGSSDTLRDLRVASRLAAGTDDGESTAAPFVAHSVAQL